METKSFFGEQGLTSTSANHYANLAKEMTRKIKERLDSTRFYDTEMRILGDSGSSTVSKGIKFDAFDDIKTGLELITGCNSLIAFFREAIKEKERLAKEAMAYTDVSRHADFDRRYGEHEDSRPLKRASITEEGVVRSWTVGEQEKYLSLQAEAAVYGKFIHEDGSLSEARAALTRVINNPTVVKEAGRDTILYSFVPTVAQSDVDDLFFQLQAHYREVQAELNGMKKRIDDAVQEDAQKAESEYRADFSKWSARDSEFRNELQLIVADDNIARQARLKAVQALKIVVPNRLQKVFKDLQELG